MTDPNLRRVIPRKPEPPVSTAAIRIEHVITRIRDWNDTFNDLMPAIAAIGFVALLALLAAHW